MNEQSKKDFIRNISQALGRDTVPTSVTPPDLSNGPQAGMYQDLSHDDVVEMFKKECDALQTRYTEATEDTLAEAVMDAIVDWGGGKLIYAPTEEISKYGLDQKFAEAEGKDGLTFVPWDPTQSREFNIDNAKDANLGLTFPSSAIAETATLLQPMNRETGRCIGLLPITHIAVVRRSTIVPRMTQSMAKLAEEFRNDRASFPSALVHISGPSSTVDVELVRVVGVHGPINLTYIILND